MAIELIALELLGDSRGCYGFPMTWNHQNPGFAELQIGVQNNLVTIETIAQDGIQTAAVDPETACVAASQLVRAAGEVDDQADVAMVYMPRRMWDQIATAAAVGIENDESLSAAKWPLRILNAVVHPVTA